MGRQRSRLDIIEQMLAYAVEKREVKPTHLMYRSNLSYAQFRSYLDELIAKGLLKQMQRGTRSVLVPTEVGAHYLEKIRDMRRFEERFGL